MTRLVTQSETEDMPLALAETLAPRSMGEQIVVMTVNDALTDYGIATLLEMVRRARCREMGALTPTEDEIIDLTKKLCKSRRVHIDDKEESS